MFEIWPGEWLAPEGNQNFSADVERGAEMNIDLFIFIYLFPQDWQW